MEERMEQNEWRKISYFLLIIICGLIAGFCADAAEKKDTNIVPYNLKDLCNACYYNEAEDVAEILKNFKGDVNAEEKMDKADVYMATPLGCAAERGDTYMMQLLLEHGAKPTSSELYMLACAVKGKQFDDCFKLLIEHGVDINARCRFDGSTPLHFSLPENIEKLVRAGADMRIKDDNECTPLYRFLRYDAADEKGIKKCIVRLLEFGAPIDEYYVKIFPWLVSIANKKERLPLLLVGGEMSKNNCPHVESLAFLSLDALYRYNKIFDKGLKDVFTSCVGQRTFWDHASLFFVKKKKVLEVIEFFQYYRPEDQLDRESRSNIMSFISTYAKTETDYRLEDRFACYWGAKKESLAEGEKVKIMKEYIASRTEYLEKRISKQIGLPGLYSGQHCIRIKNGEMSKIAA
jgi:hypothetical protein